MSSKYIFIANWTQGPSMSGGDNIWNNFAKYWGNVSVIGSEEAETQLEKSRTVVSKFFKISKNVNTNNNLSLPGLIINSIVRVKNLLLFLLSHKSLVDSYDYVYTVSDFFPDALGGLLSKLINPYLFAPKIFGADSPYRGKHLLKGLVYQLIQLPMYLVIKHCADYILVTSSPDAPKFFTKKRDSSRIVVVRGGVDTVSIDEYLKPNKLISYTERAYDGIFVGRLHMQKGVMDLVDIWKYVVEEIPGVRLVIVGDGELREDLIKKISTLGLENNIDLAGYKNGEDKFRLFRDSKIMLHPATYDSGGMACAEGMAWGLPAVGYALEAFETYYERGMLKAPVHDKKGFAQLIVNLLKDDSLFFRTSQEAYDYIREKWMWEQTCSYVKSNIELGEGSQVKCPVCQSEKTKFISETFDTHGRYINSEDLKFRMFKCLTCNVMFLSGVVIDNKYYRDNYGSGYYGTGNNKLISKITRLGFKISVFIKEKMIFKYTNKDKINILDIGCGDCSFLQSVSDKSFIKTGIDMNPEVDKISVNSSIVVHRGDVLSHNFGKSMFDCVTMWNVLEHTTDPGAVLQRVQGLLYDDGILLIQVPNYSSLGYFVGKKLWFHLDSPRHLYLFNSKSIYTLASRNGFIIDKMYREPYDYPLDLFWSVRRSIFLPLFILFYPILKLFDREVTTYALRKVR
ncbi:MAG: Glycosyltransferase [candidate division WWE3 bacterium GW2011_GWD2_42_11]|nr:MAG: Glycosyltransferase [candidate division WWE3 bacterium GW2011_GWD2_42_11]